MENISKKILLMPLLAAILSGNINAQETKSDKYKEVISLQVENKLLSESISKEEQEKREKISSQIYETIFGKSGLFSYSSLGEQYAESVGFSGSDLQLVWNEDGSFRGIRFEEKVYELLIDGKTPIEGGKTPSEDLLKILKETTRVLADIKEKNSVSKQ